MTARQELLIGLAGLTILAAVAGLVVQWRVSGGERSAAAVPYSPAPPQMPLDSASAPTPTPSASAPARIVIPSIGVDAPVSVKGFDTGGVMEAPDGPKDVAWYEFSARPGGGSNAVFSAHVDYLDYGPAVFARLKDLKKGDAVEVRLADDTVYRYEVVLSLLYAADAAPFQDIVGPTSREVITLITCAGAFDEATRLYSDRLVVRAERS